MARLPSTTLARYRAAITRIESQLDTLYTALSGMDEAKSYELDTGAGRQKTSVRTFFDIQAQVTRLEGQLEFFYRKVEGTGLVSMAVRR